VPSRYQGQNATSADWGSVYVHLPWWMYQYYDDERVLKENYEG
jgi:hypothetical protein